MGAQRPFYGSFAWAYDMLVDRPVAAECRFVADRLAAGGVVSGARVLDAGCGTGRYAAELAHHGYRVTGLDRSPALAVVARRRRSAGLHVAVADLAALPLRAEYAAVLCRASSTTCSTTASGT